MMQLATVCVLQFCLPIAPNRVPPYETDFNPVWGAGSPKQKLCAMC